VLWNDHVLHPAVVGFTGASGTVVLGSKASGVGHGQARWSRQCQAYGGQSHRTAARAASSTAALTRRGGAGRRQQLEEAWCQALGAEERGIDRGIELQAWTSGAQVTVTMALW
jgi:hypothetical protein